MRKIATFPLAPGQLQEIKNRMLNWANRFSILLFLDSNSYPARYELLLAVDAVSSAQGSLAALQQHHDEHKDWLFGHISYDHKNSLEPKLRSGHTAHLGFPELHFFCPAIVCYIRSGGEELFIESLSDEPAEVYQQILDSSQVIADSVPALTFTSRTEKAHYLQTVEALREHIAAGDCYEINYCAEAFALAEDIDPVAVFNKLNTFSPSPFAAYYRVGNDHLMCSSPERYLEHRDGILRTQPIKGTAPRGTDKQSDEAFREALHTSIKERAENIMITDLCRNDLARSCETGTVRVEELFGIYSFPRVHQMISTVSGKMKDGLPFTDAIRFSFPMGSMTGAPKVKVMQLIEQYEQARRELYSGTVGYIDPHGNFDLNVVIRSLFYNAATSRLSYQAGGAITYDSVAESEWQEMRLKASAMEGIFSGA